MGAHRRGARNEAIPAATASVLGLVIGGCLVGIVALGDLRAQLVPFTLLFGLAFVAYLGAIWCIAQCPWFVTGWRLWPLVGLGLLFRLFLLPAAPSLSDDLYRYVWEGRVLAAGFSPYRDAPTAPALASLRDEDIWPHVNNPDVPSPYPPVALLGGLLGSALTPHATLGVKLVATAGDLLVLGGLLVLLSATGAPLAWILVYVWHPLVVMEFSHSGHNDSLMLAPLVLALALAARGRRWWPASLIAVAALAKILPLLLLPLLPRRLGLGPTTLIGALVALVWMPFLVLGDGAIGSIVTYLGQFADNDSIHALLRTLVGSRGATVFGLLFLAAGVGAVATAPTLFGRPLWWQVYAVLALALLLASTVHAWYLTWLIPFLAVRCSDDQPSVATRGAPARWPLRPASTGWLLFSGLVVLPYLTYDTHTWQLWISVAEYAPLFGFLAIPVFKHMRTSGERRGG